MRRMQKRLSTRTSFAFGETELTYTFAQGTLVKETSFDYLHLPRSRRHIALSDWSRFQLGLLLLIAGAIAIAVGARLSGFHPLELLWLAPGCLLLALFATRQAHFLIIEGGGEALWIIDDKACHEIVAEMDRRRRDRIADIYGHLNLANEAYLEIRKIEWLVTEAVLTRDEADEQIRIVNGVAIARAEAAAEGKDKGLRGLFEKEAIAG